MSLLLLAAVPLPPVPSQAYQFWLQIVTLLVAAFLTWDSRRTVGEARSVMNELKVQVNGRLSQLLETAKIADHAVGFEQGRATAAAEAAAVPAAAAAAAAAAVTVAGCPLMSGLPPVAVTALNPLPVVIASPNPLPVTVLPTEPPAAAPPAA